MKTYQCHKRVQAAKITRITPALGRGQWDLHFDDGNYVTVKQEFILKHNPHPGGYYIVYDDLHASFTPAAAFEKGYTEVKDVKVVKGVRPQ